MNPVIRRRTSSPRRAHRQERLVTVVFITSRMNVYFVEARAHARAFVDPVEHVTKWRVDREAAEKAARQQLPALGVAGDAEYICILVAHDSYTPGERGRISKAIEIEPRTTVQV